MNWLLPFMVLLWLLTPKAWADAAQALEQELGLDEVQQAAEEAAGELLPETDLLGETDLGSGLLYILEQGLGYLGGYWKNAVRTGALMISIVLLCALVRLFQPGMQPDAIQAAGAFAITAACTGSVHQMIGFGTQTLERLQTFSAALLPAMAAAAAASGTPATSAAIYAAAVLFSDFTMELITQLFVPLVYAYLVTQTADTALGSDALSRLGGLCKWMVTLWLKLCITVYLGWLSITGVVSGTADAATVKAAKLALSTAVPVVGSIISDASETVLVSAGLLKSSLGVLGMLTVVALCLLPFLRIGTHYLVFKGAAAVAGSLDSGRLSKLIDSLGSAMGMLLAMTGAEALMMLLSLVCSMKAVAG